MTVGERIKFLRERSGMTQSELAKKIGVNFPAISKYELGTVDNLPLKKIEALAEALGVTGAQLLGWEDIQIQVLDLDQNRVVQKKKELRQIIDDAPEEWLDLIERVLTMPQQQLEALASLLRPSKDD